MKTTFRTITGIVLIATCLMGTTSFADSNSNNTAPIESVEMKSCTAKELVGAYPKNISQNHRDTLDGALGRIDIYNAAGDHEVVNKLWKIVDEILGSYNNSNSTQSKSGDFMTFDDFIKNYGPTLSQSNQNILRGYFQNVIAAYKSGDQQLIIQADQTFFTILDSMINNKINNIKPDYVNGNTSSEDDWEAPVGNNKNNGQNPIDPDINHGFDHVINNLPQNLDSLVRVHIQELIDEIRHFESVGNFLLADQLRDELFQILDIVAGQVDPDFDPDMME